jgi:hypothetical protein
MATALSLDQAFEILETQSSGIPWEALQFLYEHPADPRIEKQILFALENAYSDAFVDPYTNTFLDTVLWYAFVAENHLSESLMDPVIRLFTTSEEDWDFLNEQGVVLVGKLAKKYGDKFISRVIDAIELSLLDGPKKPTLFLHDAFFFCDFPRYQERLHKLIFNSDYEWKDPLLITVGSLKYPSVIPILEEYIASFPEEDELDKFEAMNLREAQEALRIQKGESDRIPLSPFSEDRKDWKTYLKQFERHFEAEPEPILPAENKHYEEIPAGVKKKKIGRNEPCPCGSGKKYKKCCLQSGIYE